MVRRAAPYDSRGDAKHAKLSISLCGLAPWREFENGQSHYLVPTWERGNEELIDSGWGEARTPPNVSTMIRLIVGVRRLTPTYGLWMMVRRAAPYDSRGDAKHAKLSISLCGLAPWREFENGQSHYLVPTWERGNEELIDSGWGEARTPPNVSTMIRLIVGVRRLTPTYGLRVFAMICVREQKNKNDS